MGLLDGKVAIVTGALGIGLAAARKLAVEGASVVVCSDHEDQVEEAVADLREEALEVRGMRANVTSSTDMEKLVGFATESYGGVIYSSMPPASSATGPWRIPQRGCGTRSSA